MRWDEEGCEDRAPVPLSDQRSGLTGKEAASFTGRHKAAIFQLVLAEQWKAEQRLYVRRLRLRCFIVVNENSFNIRPSRDV